MVFGDSSKVKHYFPNYFREASLPVVELSILLTSKRQNSVNSLSEILSPVREWLWICTNFVSFLLESDILSF